MALSRLTSNWPCSAWLRAPADGGAPAEVVWLSPGALVEDPKAESALRERRAEDEEGRYQPEDWPGNPWRPQPELRVTNPVDVAAAVAAAGVVVAHSGALMALAWALGVPHVALGPEESAPSAFAAWTGDASALAADPGEIVATIPNIFARTGKPPGFKRLEATLDQALDESAEITEENGSRRFDERARKARVRAPPWRPGSTSSRPSMRRSASGWRPSGCGSASAPPCSKKRPIPASSRPSRPYMARTSSCAGAWRWPRRSCDACKKRLPNSRPSCGLSTAPWPMRALAPARDFYDRLRKAPR